jgi:hypothetical protein
MITGLGLRIRTAFSHSRETQGPHRKSLLLFIGVESAPKSDRTFPYDIAGACSIWNGYQHTAQDFRRVLAQQAGKAFMFIMPFHTYNAYSGSKFGHKFNIFLTNLPYKTRHN